MNPFSRNKQVIAAGKIAPAYFAIRELPLVNFIDCSVDNDLAKLLKSGESTSTQLEERWMDILSEYYLIRNDETSATYLEIQKDIWLLQTRINHINGLIAYIVKVNNQQATTLIQEYGYWHLSFTIETIEEDIKEVIRTEANTVCELTMLRMQLQEINGGRIEKVKAEDYYHSVEAYNETKHGSKSVDKMTTYEYAIIMNRLEEHYKNIPSGG